MTSLISYAQNFEDVMLWRALKHVENGFYIDLGAQDPVVDSVSLAFHEHGWKGIHVEPAPHYAQMLRAQRPGDTVVEAAVGNDGDLLTFYEAPGTGISTGDPQIAQQHRERGFDIREITVPCVRLSSIFKACGRRDIHWMKIDVEGFEWNALTSWGKSAARPWIVVVESTLPMTQVESHERWEPLLLRRGYTSVYFDGLNRYYVSKEKADLTQAFYAPPNVFDDFSVNGTASTSLHRHLTTRHAAELAEVGAQVQRASSEVEELKHSLTKREIDHGEQLRESLAQLDARKEEVLLLEQAHRTEISSMQAEVVRASGLLVAAKDESGGLLHAAQQEALKSAQALAAREQEFSAQVAAREQAHRTEISSMQAEVVRASALLIAVKDEFAGVLRAAEQESLKAAHALTTHEREASTRLHAQEQEFRKVLLTSQTEIARITNLLADAKDQYAILQRSTQQELREAGKSLLDSEQRTRDEANRFLARERELGEQLLAGADAFATLQREAEHEQTKLLQEIAAVRENADLLMRAQLQREQDLLNKVSTANAKITQLEHAQARVTQELGEQFAQAAQTTAQLQQMLSTTREEQAALRNTLSWRLTAPLRAIGKRFRRNGETDIATSIVYGARSNSLPSDAPDGAAKSNPTNADSSNLQKAPMFAANSPSNSPTNISHTQTVADLLSLDGEQFIEGAYLKLLKRAPDSSGGKFYLDRLIGGVAKTGILAEIGSSAEAQLAGAVNLAELLSFDGEQFVENCYLRLLDRQADTSGRVHYLSRLEAGEDKATIIGDLLRSDEGRQVGVQVTDYDMSPSNEIAGTSGADTAIRAQEETLGVALPMKKISYAELASLNGEQFVENCYLQLLHRHVDPTGRAGYLSQLEAGEDKVTLIECILRSDEGRRVGEQVSGLWTRSIRRRLEKWPMLGAFLPIQTSEIDQALRAIDNKLYRLIEAYATPEASNLGTPGAEPAVDIALLPKPKSLSNEASATSETSVFAAANAKEDFAMSPAPKPQSLPIEESAASLENNLAAARSEPTVATLPILKPQLLPPPPTVTLAKQNHPSIFLLVDARRGPVSGGTGVIGRLGRAFLARGESILFVQWNAEAKNFQLVTRTELAHFELAAGMDEMAAIYPMNNEKPTVIEPSTCGAGDWLLVPEMIRVTTDRPQLLEMDMIMEARRLGLGAAFIFHGAEPLRLKQFAGSDADVYEQYMQALLLADAIIPVSTLAADDLKAFFVQHQKADSVPLIQEIPLPAETQRGATHGWSDYVRRVQGVLTDAADKSHSLAALYYWIDLSAPPGTTGSVFARRLASALTERGIALIPVAWDAADKRLIPTDGKCPDHLKHACAPGSWAAWIEPGLAGAPQWVFRPDEVLGELLAEVAAYAKSRRLRTAAILPDAINHRSDGDFAPPNAQDWLLFEALAGIDKVLATSERRFRQFHHFLLTCRGKVHSAEQRFRTLASPNETPGPQQQTWGDYAKEVAIELATDRLIDGLRPVEMNVGGDLYAALANLRRRPKLSLCISTYNRAGWVEVNLRNIFSQIGTPRDDLEVLVVDNTSVDHTTEVVQPYLTRPDFRYVRNPKNVGMLGNLAVTAQRAKGEYIWIIGDDDLTRSGVVERILEIINQHPGIGLIYMNYGYTSEADPANVTDLTSFLANYNTLEPAGPDQFAPVKLLAAKCENFFTAIYSHVYRRDHALKSYCQDTSGRIFSTMLSCVPTAYYVLNYMADEPAYWIGEPSLVVNSNVSWQDYGVLLDLEQLPRTWDLAERMGTPLDEVDRRRANRLWLVEMMWKEIFENDKAGNSAYFSAVRVLMRLKHLKELDKHIPELMSVYERARVAGHPAAIMPTDELFTAFGNLLGSPLVSVSAKAS